MDNAMPEEEKSEAEREAEKLAFLAEKFSGAEKLVKAYTALEAEFSRKCARLKELEAELKTAKAAPPSEEELLPLALKSGRVRDAVIGEYLKEVSKTRVVKLVSGGCPAAAPRDRPASVKEAGRLASEFLNMTEMYEKVQKSTTEIYEKQHGGKINDNSKKCRRGFEGLLSGRGVGSA